MQSDIKAETVIDKIIVSWTQVQNSFFQKVLYLVHKDLIQKWDTQCPNKQKQGSNY